MGRRHISLGGIIWIVIGIVVAANHHFLSALNTAPAVASAVLAVILWPLVLLGIHIAV
ncbi:MAG: hypothetical protein ACYDH5_15995 [Acidimicrobiales bacterium]